MAQQQAATETPQPEQISAILGEIAEKSRAVVEEFIERQSKLDAPSPALNPVSVGNTFFELTSRMMQNPVDVMQAQFDLWQDEIYSIYESRELFWSTIGPGGMELRPLYFLMLHPIADAMPRAHELLRLPAVARRVRVHCSARVCWEGCSATTSSSGVTGIDRRTTDPRSIAPHSARALAAQERLWGDVPPAPGVSSAPEERHEDLSIPELPG